MKKIQRQTLIKYTWVRFRNCWYVVGFGLVPQKSFRMAAFNIHEPLINISFLSMCLHKYLDDFVFSLSSIFCGIFFTSKENRPKAYSKDLINLKIGILHHRFIEEYFKIRFDIFLVLMILLRMYNFKIFNKCICLISICYINSVLFLFSD